MFTKDNLGYNKSKKIIQKEPRDRAQDHRIVYTVPVKALKKFHEILFSKSVSTPQRYLIDLYKEQGTKLA